MLYLLYSSNLGAYYSLFYLKQAVNIVPTVSGKLSNIEVTNTTDSMLTLKIWTMEMHDWIN